MTTGAPVRLLEVPASPRHDGQALRHSLTGEAYLGATERVLTGTLDGSPAEHTTCKGADARTLNSPEAEKPRPAGQGEPIDLLARMLVWTLI